MQPQHLFLVKPTVNNASNKNTFLICARHADEGKLIYSQRANRNEPKKVHLQLTATEFSAEQIHLPEEMLSLAR